MKHGQTKIMWYWHWTFQKLEYEEVFTRRDRCCPSSVVQLKTSTRTISLWSCVWAQKAKSWNWKVSSIPVWLSDFSNIIWYSWNSCAFVDAADTFHTQFQKFGLQENLNQVKFTMLMSLNYTGKATNKTLASETQKYILSINSLKNALQSWVVEMQPQISKWN